MKVSVINGPNINLLGGREKEHYGNVNYGELEHFVKERAGALGIDIVFFQSNCEGEIVDKIQDCAGIDAFVINAAAYTHTSIAIRDALLASKKPFVEVHISNIYARESFRHKSMLSDVADGVISGLGKYSYSAAMEYLSAQYL